MKTVYTLAGRVELPLLNVSGRSGISPQRSSNRDSMKCDVG
ncbi:hypothetical protein AHF37_09176 [Paragonimus kellicotti]|nr:hypothetical protein AHF37_09176 [Paragonimus kellicotti]